MMKISWVGKVVIGTLILHLLIVLFSDERRTSSSGSSWGGRSGYSGGSGGSGGFGGGHK